MFTLPELPYSFDALEPYIDTLTMQIHHDKHHAAYVKNLNDLLVGSDLINLPIDQLINQLDKVPEEIRQKVKNNAGGHFNHSLFWRLLSPQHLAPSPRILALKEEFNKKAMSIFGSGWVWITVNSNQPGLPAGRLSVISTQNQDVPKEKVVLGLDVWEHAYYLKYQNRRAEYIEAFWNIINWTEVEKNLTI